MAHELELKNNYLTVPVDILQRLTSPPCSPIPADWHDSTESPPMQVGDFDLDAAEGIVNLGDGRIINLAECPPSKFGYIRKGAIITKVSSIDNSKRTLLNEVSTNHHHNRIVPPPIIIIDYYE